MDKMIAKIKRQVKTLPVVTKYIPTTRCAAMKFLPKGFRYLYEGEIIRKEDYYWNQSKGCWILTKAPGRRNRIVSSKQSGYCRRKRKNKVGKRACKNAGCNCSTGIHGGITFGHGKLSANGYWEFPCRPCAEAFDARKEERLAALIAEYGPAPPDDPGRYDWATMAAWPYSQGIQQYFDSKPLRRVW